MGLGGRKQKQRIPADPRNLAWINDAATFGQSYLSKFGWDPTKGLGASGDGRTSHIKVSQKLDMLGIGAAQQNHPDGIAWKQNKDFESVLQRLNEAAATQTNDSGRTSEQEDDDPIPIQEDDDQKKAKKREKKEKKKRKREEEEGLTERKEKKRRKRDTEDALDTKPLAANDTPAQPQSPKPAPASRPQVKAHRARFLASKNIASKSASAIAEILGISSKSTSTTGTSTPIGGTLTPINDDEPCLGKLTTSTKSVADYFKERMLSKSGRTTPTPSPLGRMDDEDDRPKSGIGSSKLRYEVDEEESVQSQGIGMSAFASLRSSAFLSSMTFMPSTPSTEENSVPPVLEPETQESVAVAESSVDDKEARRKKKKQKRGVESLAQEEPTPEPEPEQSTEKRKKKKRKEKDGDEDEETGSKDKPKRKDKEKRSKLLDDEISKVAPEGEEPTRERKKRTKERDSRP